MSAKHTQIQRCSSSSTPLLLLDPPPCFLVLHPSPPSMCEALHTYGSTASAIPAGLKNRQQRASERASEREGESERKRGRERGSERKSGRKEVASVCESERARKRLARSNSNHIHVHTRPDKFDKPIENTFYQERTHSTGTHQAKQFCQTNHRQ